MRSLGYIDEMLLTDSRRGGYIQRVREEGRPQIIYQITTGNPGEVCSRPFLGDFLGGRGGRERDRHLEDRF